jgi:hypothetical protein
MKLTTAALALVLGTAVSLRADISPEDWAKAAKAVSDLRELSTNIQLVSPEAEPKVPKPRKDTKGKYISPYRADGTLAPWAEKAMAGSAAAALGNKAGDELGKLASEKLASKVPGGAVLGSLFGKKAKKTLAETAAVKAVGGWDYIKETSDMSFNSTMDLAVYMHVNYAGSDSDFAKAMGAAMGIYPRLVGAYEPAIKRAYGRDAVVKAQDAKRNGTLPKLPDLPSLPPLPGALANSGSADEDAVQAGFMQTAVAANSLESSGGIGGSAADLMAQEVAPPPDVAPIKLNTSKEFTNKLKFANRTNRVVVAGFRVGFVVRDSVTASVAAGCQFGGTHTSGAKSKTAVELAGVDTATLQKITEQLYQDFVADLEASGREVLTLEEVRATEGYAKLDKTEKLYTKEAKFLGDRMLPVYTPEELPRWWEHGNQIGDKSPFAIGNWKVLGAISVDLNAVVLAPTYLISFAELESSGNKRGLFSGYGSGRAKTSAAPNRCRWQGETEILAIHFKKKIAGDMANVALRKTVVVGDFGAEMVTLDESDNNNAARAGLLGLAQTTGSQGIFAVAGASRSCKLSRCARIPDTSRRIRWRRSEG